MNATKPATKRPPVKSKARSAGAPVAQDDSSSSRITPGSDDPPDSVLRELQRRADAMTRGDFSSLGQPLGGSHEAEALRRTMDVMGAHLEQAQRSIHDYVASSTAAQEAERARLARELHDDTVQQIIALGQGVERVQRLLHRDPSQAAQRLKTLREMTTALVQSLRVIVGNLRPPALEELGLVAAVQLLVQRRGSGAPQASLSVRGQVRRLDADSELALFRIIQEAWNNALKHAHAKRVRITFAYNRRNLVVTIADDGTGLSPTGRDDKRNNRNSDGQPSSQRQWGLIGMHERARLINGSVTIESKPGRGARVVVRAPYLGLGGQDPVCGMKVGPDGLTVGYRGTLYRFCSQACREAFLAEPKRYVQAATAAAAA